MLRSLPAAAALVARSALLASAAALSAAAVAAAAPTEAVPPAALPAPLPAGALVLRDDLRRDVTFAHPPRRVISLLPSLTETVCALGACDRLLATDRFSNWPERVRTLPKLGGLDDASIEAIVDLRPDVVLLSRSQRITQRLGELHVPTFALEALTYADIGRVAGLVGAMLGESAAATRLGRSIDDDVAHIGAGAVAQRRGAWPRVYFEVDAAPYAAGPGSFIGELLSRLGTRNIVAADLGPYPKLNPEYVVRADPDLIVVPPGQSAALAGRPGWGAIRAVKEHRLCAFSSAAYDTVVRPGPRVADGMRALAACLARFAP